MSLELKKAIDEISKLKGLDRETLIKTLEDAVRTSVTRKYGDALDVEVHYSDDTGEIEVYQFKIVKDDVEDDLTQISLEEARQHDPTVQLEDEMGFRLKIEDFGRIAAQSAKQVIITRMRSAEQGIIYAEYKDRIGEIVSGLVQRRDKRGWIVNLGRTEAILPRNGQIPKEHFKRNDRIQAIITKVNPEGRDPQIEISRSHRDYMAALFRREVPEIDDGSVQIMGIARDPGSRAKVAVLSRDRDIDPVGSCVGVRGSRIQNIVQELHGERIDIVVWNADIATYVRNALAPAVVTGVSVETSKNLLSITVPDEQLTNAIGKKGQNVKLAAQLLGWKIDIYTESNSGERNTELSRMKSLASAVDLSVERFEKAGFATLDSVAEADDGELKEKLHIDMEKIKDLRAAIGLLSHSSIQSDEEADGE